MNRRNERFHFRVESRQRHRDTRVPHRFALSSTTLADDPPIPSTIRIGPGAGEDDEEESPSTVYRQEGAATRQHVSSDKPQHRFWLPSALEVPLAALQSVDGYSGSVLQHSNGTVFVEEVVPPGSLVIPHYISSRPIYTEAECRSLFRQLCQQIQVLHNLRTVHRNVHLNHLVVDQKGHTSLRGFQHSVVLKQRTRRGTYYTDAPLDKSRRPYDWYAFRAPELEDDGRHGTAVDVWSAGICLYMMITGLPPFRGSGRELRRQKMNAELADFDIVVPSRAAQDLLKKMVTVDAKERLTIDQVLKHEWLQDESNAVVVHYSEYDLSLSQAFLQDWGHKAPRRRSSANSIEQSTTTRRQIDCPTQDVPVVRRSSGMVLSSY